MRDAWSKAGHAMGDLQATAFALGCVLKDGEPGTPNARWHKRARAPQ